jgi:hypothetical protein
VYGAEAGGEEIDYDANYWLSKPYPIDFDETRGVGSPVNEHPIELGQTYPGAIGVICDYDATATFTGPVNADYRSDDIGLRVSGDFVFAACYGTSPNVYSDQKVIFTNDSSVLTAFSEYTDVGDPNLPTLQAATSLLTNFGGNAGTSSQVEFTGVFRVIVEKATQAYPGSGGGLAAVAYTDDGGETFSPQTIGDAPGAFGGCDTIRIGDVCLAGIDGQVMKSSAGGAFAAYGSAMPTGGQPNAIYIPRFKFGTTDQTNTTSDPEYLVASDTLTAGNEALWKVTSTGTVFTDITPHDGTNYGLAVAHNCMSMHWKSGSKIAGVFQFGAGRKLAVSEDAGASWAFQVLNANALSVEFRKGDPSATKLYISNGNPAYSPDLGDSVTTKAFPGDASTNPILGMQIYS